MPTTLDRRSWLRLQVQTAVFAATAPYALGASAQPSSGKIVVGLAAGGTPDVLARIVADHLQRGTGQSYIVENRTGASGRIAVEHVKSASPDGSTLLMVPQGPMTLFPHVFTQLRFDPNKDFAPISMVATSDIALVVGPGVVAKDLAGFRDWARGAGAQAAYGSPGNGTLLHFAGVALSRALGTPMTNVPYRGTALSLIDVAAGTLPCAITSVTDALELHKAGRVRILATAGASRSELLPSVPTLKEQGIDLDIRVWFALYAPTGTPMPVVEKLRAAIHAGLQADATRTRLTQLGLKPAPSTSAELMEVQQRESALWESVVRASGFKPTD